MKRRTFLASGVSGVPLGVAGCSEIQSIMGGGAEPLGEAVARNGVEVTVTDYDSANTIGFEHRSTGHVMEKSAPEGATYLLTRMTSRHVGESERGFPVRGFNRWGEDQIKMFYNGERLSSPREEATSSIMHASGQPYPCYIHDVPREPVYEGSASGWLCNEVTADFDPSNLTCEVTWGGSTTTWTYSSEP